LASSCVAAANRPPLLHRVPSQPQSQQTAKAADFRRCCSSDHPRQFRQQRRHLGPREHLAEDPRQAAERAPHRPSIGTTSPPPPSTPAHPLVGRDRQQRPLHLLLHVASTHSSKTPNSCSRRIALPSAPVPAAADPFALPRMRQFPAQNHPWSRLSHRDLGHGTPADRGSERKHTASYEKATIRAPHRHIFGHSLPQLPALHAPHERGHPARHGPETAALRPPIPLTFNLHPLTCPYTTRSPTLTARFTRTARLPLYWPISP